MSRSPQTEPNTARHPATVRRWSALGSGRLPAELLIVASGLTARELHTLSGAGAGRRPREMRPEMRPEMLSGAAAPASGRAAAESLRGRAGLGVVGARVRRSPMGLRGRSSRQEPMRGYGSGRQDLRSGRRALIGLDPGHRRAPSAPGLLLPHAHSVTKPPSGGSGLGGRGSVRSVTCQSETRTDAARVPGARQAARSGRARSHPEPASGRDQNREDTQQEDQSGADRPRSERSRRSRSSARG